MAPNGGESPGHIVIEVLKPQKGQAEPCGEAATRLRRWLISFSSGREWYPVGEFAALDATSAIDVFGAATDCHAEEIPWDAAPLVRLKQIITWALKHRERTGKLPQYKSGPVQDAPGETWDSVDSALRYGKRGLVGGSSLAKLLAASGLSE
jgi:hypothetical protein